MPCVSKLERQIQVPPPRALTDLKGSQASPRGGGYFSDHVPASQIPVDQILTRPT